MFRMLFDLYPHWGSGRVITYRDNENNHNTKQIYNLRRSAETVFRLNLSKLLKKSGKFISILIS